MKPQRFPHRYLVTAILSVSSTFIVMPATAGLVINEPTSRIGWGGANNLEEARSIMRSTTTPSANTATIRRIDNGYSNNRITSNSGRSSATIRSTDYGNTGYGNNGGFDSYNSRSSTHSFSGSNDTFYGTDYDTQLAITTGSPGVLVLDVETNQPIYQKDADIARPIASITKLMTAMVLLDAGQDMREEIKIESIDFVGPKRASSRLKSGDRMNRAELMLMMLMKSENPAAKSLARHYPGGYDAFMAAMNQKAQSLGMTSAFFGDPTGLDKRNVASPIDLAKMVKAAGNYEVIRRFSTTTNYDFFVANYSAGNRTYPARNTSYLVRDQLYPIGISKTGFIDESGKCVVMETRVNNRPAIIVILGARNSRTRWDDAENILNSLYLRHTV